jgi:hypothetical protein
MPGPGDRIYWLLFDGLPQTKYGKDIPRDSKDDESALAKQHLGDHITPKTTFGELYNSRSTSTLVPLEEYVFERWHFRRIITIGDSAHKVSCLLAHDCMANLLTLQFDPASGQGANSAIESAAVLVNALLRMLEKSPDCLSGEDVVSALSEVHERRHKHTKRLVDQAHVLQTLISQRRPFSSFILKYVMPLIGLNTLIDVIVPTCVEAPKIEKLPVPKRRRFIPFKDELPATPINNVWALWIPWALASGFLGLLLCAAAHSTPIPRIFSQCIYLQQYNLAIHGSEFSHELDIGLLTNLVPTFVAWLVESRRYGNAISPLSLLVD